MSVPLPLVLDAEVVPDELVPFAMFPPHESDARKTAVQMLRTRVDIEAPRG
jgi:hypothetical protein